MFRYLIQPVTIFLFITCLLVLQVKSVQAQYTPPTTVTVTMYQLDGDGNSTGILCDKDDAVIAQSFGCTGVPNNQTFAYPFDTNVITLGIDDLTGPSNGAYAYPYLWDVVAREYDLDGSQGAKPLAGVKAQAIASRTYLYDRILRGIAVENSASSSQVFLPYAYMWEITDGTGTNIDADEQAVMTAATQDRYYITPGQDNPATAHNEAIYPIPAFFGADNFVDTTEGTPEPEGLFTGTALTNYLRSVTDSINADFGCWIADLNGDGEANRPAEFYQNNAACGTPYGGMSSKGASRWSYGHTSSIGPVAVGHVNYPHDAGGYGNFWSVELTRTEQILTHYYTSIHLRDAATIVQAIQTPTRRWVPLEIFGLSNPTDPVTICKTGGGFGARIQNTGVLAWGGDAYNLSYRSPSWLPTSEQSVNAAAFLPPVLAGSSTTALVSVNVPSDVVPGSYTIELDMLRQLENGDYEWFSDDGWARYPLNVEVIAECEAIYLPLIQQDAVTAANE